MKRIQLMAHDLAVYVDGVAIVLPAMYWAKIGLDDHIDYAEYDAASDRGEIQWCVNPITGRKPANEKVSSKSWSPYFDQGLIERAVKQWEIRKAEIEAEIANAEAAKNGSNVTVGR